MKKLFTLIMASLCCNLALANEMEFSISDESVEASYQAYYSNNFSSRLSLMKADVDNVDSNLLDFGLYANGQTGKVRTHMGGKVFWLDGENHDTRGIAIGGAVDAYIAPKVFIVVSAHFAPDILTGGDLDNFTDYSLRLSYDLLDNASLFIGYRYIEAEKDDFEYEAFDGGFAGFRFKL